MGTTEKFKVRAVTSGKVWNMCKDSFKAIVYVPDSDVPEVINLGMDSPYLIVLPEKELSEEEAIDFSKRSGFDAIVSITGGSVVFVYPTCEGGWKNADAGLFRELIENSKIGPVYSDGILENIDRFGNNLTDYYIRGAVFKTYLYGFGESADFIAKNLLNTIEGQYLWGPGEITPAVVSMERLSVIPKLNRKDIPVLSVGNSDEINKALKEGCEKLLVVEQANYSENYHSFVKRYKRWCGSLIEEPDYEALGMINEYGVETVKTSPDNAGEFEGTTEHKVGYVVWYNKGLLDGEKVPTLIANHGGGDSALYIAKVSGWWEVAHKYNFLLIAIENHTSVTATETLELLDKIKEKYKVDENRLYATGFSMGGCKSWDFYQEYPERFAALAPMDATFDVGLNFFGKPAIRVNSDISVPVFYSGGEITPLPELPFQEVKCFNRIKNLLEVNRAKKKYDTSFEEHDNWENPIWGITGDRIEQLRDESRDSTLTIHYFENVDEVENIALSSVDNQGHECRQHTCEQAWLFMSKFKK